ncbi:MAG TPA: hypothetical protein VFP64_00070, partial [Pyrinomonadaceae bacterium]|nr:hypothetical protein [Pyrinomonadaceae bacterium]
PEAAKPTTTTEPRSTVKRVLMPLDKKPVDASKSATKSTTTTQAPAAPAEQQRPRRIQPQ